MLTKTTKNFFPDFRFSRLLRFRLFSVALSNKIKVFKMTLEGCYIHVSNLLLTNVFALGDKFAVQVSQVSCSQCKFRPSLVSVSVQR